MFKNYAFILAFFFIAFSELQGQAPQKNAELEAKAVGGKEQIEQVLQTQLSLPKSVLTSNFEKEITIFFGLDSLGKALNFKFESGLNNVLRLEMKRIFNFLKFNKTQSYFAEAQPYFLIFKLSTQKYNRYFKQQSKLNLKKNVIADSSYVIYSKADKSPEYFKNADEGLSEFILSEIEYPKLAIEKSIEGTVIVEFIIETNGYVTAVTAKQTVSVGCTDEAVRLIKQTKWWPAQLRGKAVRYKTSYPITFSLRNVNKEHGSTQPIGQ